MVSEGRLTPNEIVSNSDYDSMPRKPPVPLGTLKKTLSLLPITSRDLGPIAALQLARFVTLVELVSQSEAPVDRRRGDTSTIVPFGLLLIFMHCARLSHSPGPAPPRSWVQRAAARNGQSLVQYYIVVSLQL